MVSIVENNRSELVRLCREHRVSRLELFGSAAVQVTFDPQQNDLDFLVEFQPMAPEEHAEAYITLLFAIRDLFGRDVDLGGRERSRIPISWKASTRRERCCTQREVRKFLFDISVACKNIDGFLHDAARSSRSVMSWFEEIVRRWLPKLRDHVDSLLARSGTE